MKKLIPILLILLVFFTVQCGKPRDVVIYGSMTCDHCIDFMKKADSLSVKYTFKDVETNTQYYNELVKKIEDAKFQDYVSFPVVEVDGRIHVNPEFQEFQALLR